MDWKRFAKKLLFLPLGIILLLVVVSAAALVTVFVKGDVADVKTAVEAAKNDGTCDIFASYVIANPMRETRKMLESSAMRHNI